MGLWYALAGAAGGVLLGIGMGGGSLLLPLLLWLGVEQRAAQGVLLVGYLPAAAAALWMTTRQGLARWRQIWPLLPAALAGAIAGAIISGFISVTWLRRCYGGLLLVMGLWLFARLLRKKRRKPGQAHA